MVRLSFRFCSVLRASTFLLPFPSVSCLSGWKPGLRSSDNCIGSLRRPRAKVTPVIKDGGGGLPGHDGQCPHVAASATRSAPRDPAGFDATGPVRLVALEYLLR